MPTQTKAITFGDADIVARVVQAKKGDLPVSTANGFLKLGFAEVDRARAHELVVKNQDGKLTDSEQRELDSYCRIGQLLDLLAAKARRSLAKRKRSS
jgi:hypothetical protein